MNMQDKLNHLNELYKEKLSEDTEKPEKSREQMMKQCIDEAYHDLSARAIDVVEDFFWIVDPSSIPFSDESLDFLRKDLESNEDPEVESALDHVMEYVTYAILKTSVKNL